jgi:hypothetical protein
MSEAHPFLDAPRGLSAFCWGMTALAYKDSKRHKDCVINSMGGYATYWQSGIRHLCDCPCHPWSNERWITRKDDENE